MEHIITAILASISPAALPIVVCVMGCCFIYFKIQSQRKVTKSERDNTNEEFDLRLTLCEHDIEFMKEQNQIFADKLDQILSAICEIKIQLAKKVDVK